MPRQTEVPERLPLSACCEAMSSPLSFTFGYGPRHQEKKLLSPSRLRLYKNIGLLTPEYWTLNFK